jgi:hypothetical protein
VKGKKRKTEKKAKSGATGRVGGQNQVTKDVFLFFFFFFFFFFYF